MIHAGAGRGCEKAGAAIGTVWVLLGLGALLFSRDRGRFLHRISGPLMAVYAVYFSLGLLEMGARIATQHFDRAFLFFKPGMKMVLHLSRWRLPGVSPTVTFSVNALGLRGPMPPHEGRVYKIIAVGGSTTECAVLDDSQEWPQLLMEAMNRRQKTYDVWVGNAGVSGLTTVDHLFCLRRIPVLSRANMLIFLIGVNDLQAALEFGGKSTQKALEFKAKMFAEHAPSGVILAGGLFRRSWLFAWGRPAVLTLPSILRRPRAVPGYSRQQERRSAGPIVPLPNLQLGLREYAQRVRRLERECRTRRLRCIFLTQPSMWRADLPPAEQRLLLVWLGGARARAGLRLGRRHGARYECL